MDVLFLLDLLEYLKNFRFNFQSTKIYSWIARLLLNTVIYVLCLKFQTIKYLVNTLIKYWINFYKDLLYTETFCQDL